MGKKITTFSDLNIWKEGHKLVLQVYSITAKFSSSEKFVLTDRMRRAAISITSNIAEGFTRQGTKEKIQFYLMAKGSLTELQNPLHIAKDVGYLDTSNGSEITNQVTIVNKLLTGLIKGVRKFSRKA